MEQNPVIDANIASANCVINADPPIFAAMATPITPKIKINMACNPSFFSASNWRKVNGHKTARKIGDTKSAGDCKLSLGSESQITTAGPMRKNTDFANSFCDGRNVTLTSVVKTMT